jgi:hypothetical protein
MREILKKAQDAHKWDVESLQVRSPPHHNLKGFDTILIELHD